MLKKLTEETNNNLNSPIIGMVLLKQYIDNIFRNKVTPIEGSIVYTDLTLTESHSGIYIGNNKIVHIMVDPVTESFVESSSPKEFTQSNLHNKLIYVGCNSQCIVGDSVIAKNAIDYIGERCFYGLVFKNSHDFTELCLDSVADHQTNSELVQKTLKTLKSKSSKKLGITKWRLWDWQPQTNVESEPDLNAMIKTWQNLPLNQQNIQKINQALGDCKNYQTEISDEGLPKQAHQLLQTFQNGLQTIQDKYQEIQKLIPVANWDYSYNEFMNMGDDFLALLKEMEGNKKISYVVEKLGKQHISEEKKQRPKVIKRMNNEVLGIHKSNDLMRLLPSELSNLESDTLEVLFYSKMIENNLLTYELITKEYDQNSNHQEEYVQATNKNKGPIIACLDTSGSMFGIPLLKAKALLLSITKIIEKENRSLYIILFGSTGQTKELNLNKKKDMSKIVDFLNGGFGGGTDFETPLKKGIQILKNHIDYDKADILMITDGLCSLSDNFVQQLNID